MATEDIDIRIREDGARVVQRRIKDIANEARSAATGADVLKRALGALGAVLAIDKLRQYTDTWTDLNSRVKLATGSTQAGIQVMGRLSDMARRTYSSLESTTESYLSNATALKELGLSTNEALDFTESLNNALVVSGAKAERAASVQNALSKAMMLGKLSGENLNTVIATGGRVAELLADTLGVTTNELLGLGQSGKITGEVIRKSLVGNLELLREEADSMPATIGDAMVLIENAMLKAVGSFDQMIGASSMVADALIVVADNMDIIVAALLAISVGVAVAFVPKVVIAFASAIKALWMVMAMNPFIALAAAIATVITYFVLYGDEVNAGIDATTSMKDVMRALGEVAVEVWQGLVTLVSAVWGVVIAVTETAYQAITNTTDDATKDWADSYSSFYDGVGTGFAGVVKGVARTVDAIAGLLTGLLIGVVRTFSGLPEVFSSVFGKVYNAVATKIEDIVNTTIKGMNKLRSVVGKDPIELIKLEKKNVNEKAFEEYGANIANSMYDGFEQQGGYMEAKVDALFGRAAEIGKQRLKDAASEGMVDLSKGLDVAPRGPDAKELEKAAKAIEKLKNQLGSLLNTIAPVEGATLEYEKATKLLNEAHAKGIINTEKLAKYTSLLDEHYKDLIDPLGALNRSMDEQTRLLKTNNKERQIEADMAAATKDLRQQGITLTTEETTALREKMVALQELNREVAAQDALLANSVGQRQQHADQLKAIKDLMNNSESGFTSGDAAGATSGMLQGMGVDTTGMGVDFEAQQAQYQEYYNQLQEMRNSDLISEQDYWASKAQLFTQQYQGQLDQAKGFFGGLAQLQGSENKKMAAIGKKAAIANALISTYEGATKAFTSMAGIPYVGPILGAAAAAAAVVSGMAQVNAIRSQPTGFLTGGEFKVGGLGGADSQTVAFRASPGEMVSVQTPEQYRKGNPNKDNAVPEQPRNVTINQVNNFNQPSDNRTELQRAAAVSRKQRTAEARYGVTNV